jgi:hypothetical protein
MDDLEAVRFIDHGSAAALVWFGAVNEPFLRTDFLERQSLSGLFLRDQDGRQEPRPRFATCWALSLWACSATTARRAASPSWLSWRAASMANPQHIPAFTAKHLPAYPLLHIGF